MSRKALGRGLDALIPRSAAQTEGLDRDRLHRVDITQIVPNPRQPRNWFDDSKLEDLAHSIRDKGVLEPLLVRPTQGGRYELIAGERRLRAARLAGLDEVPVLFRDFEGRGSLEVALIENLQRENLNPVEEAQAYQRLAEEFGRTHTEISEQVGKDRSTIANLIRILRLPDSVLRDVSRGTLSVGHARVLLAIDDQDRQVELARQMISDGWTVREAERRLASEGRSQTRKRRTSQSQVEQRDLEVVRVEEALRYALGTEVHLSHGPHGGRIEIRYTENEELERILELLGIQIH